MVTVVAARRIAQDFLVQYCISISRKIILLEELIATPTKLLEDIALQFEYFVYNRCLLPKVWIFSNTSC